MSESEPRWEISLTRQAEKTLYRLSKNLLQRLDQAILALAAHPRPAESQPLPGYDNLYRLPIDEWRIAYAIEEERRLVLILEIAPKQQPERHRLEEESDEIPLLEEPQQQDQVAPRVVINTDVPRQLLQEFGVKFGTVGDDIYRTPGLLKRIHQKRIRVLIADDLAETQENLRKLLSFESDIEIVGMATNSEEAVQMALEQQPDVVLMDTMMPGLNGFAAAEMISQQVPSAQVIMMSIHGEADFLQRAMLAGAKEFLIKPFSSDELMASIRRVYKSAPFQKHLTAATARLRDTFKELKARIQARLLAELDPTLDISRPGEIRQAILRDRFEQILAQENIILSRSERERLFEGVAAEILDFVEQLPEQQAARSQSEAAADLDESQIRATALWFKFFKLGNSAEISLSVTNLPESLAFYEQLGFKTVDNGKIPYPWAVVSDGLLHLGLHQRKFSSPTLSYFSLGTIERMIHLPKLGIKLDNIQKLDFIQGMQNNELIGRQKFMTAEFQSPEGQRVLLAELGSEVETTPSGRKFFSKYAAFGELSLNTRDVTATLAYWEKLGFECVTRGDRPYPWAVVADGRIRLGFHQTSKFTKPAITYFAPDMPDRLKRLRKRGIQFMAEYKDKKRRRIGAVIESPDGQSFFLFTGQMKTSKCQEEKAEAPKLKVSFKVGQKVRIVEGPFEDFMGTVDEIDLDRARVRVLVSFYGRETAIELDFWQVEPG